ncbi:MAG TPA: glycosyltransferase family 1 protein [Polyangiales bacterium]|nr:glycosyltransferase family 1 protein [Polyangiales bacterium]
MQTLQRLALVTDAWHPQTNGVVNTLSRLVKHLEGQGTNVLVVTSDGHSTFPLPSYPEIRLTRDPWRAIPRLRSFDPQAVHIATEGPLGFWVSCWLRRRRLRFTTSFHTRFPEYLTGRFPTIPLAVGYTIERWFHGRAEQTLVGTQSLINELTEQRIGRRLLHWPRGVDTERFHPRHRRLDTYPLPRPIWLYVGRVAFEKRLEDFLALPLPGTKVVVGDGPSRADLQQRFPDTVWRGWRFGDDLTAHFASADCFVFPSRTETFGNVLLEALASGLPVASVPAPGPVDLIQEGFNGAIDESLLAACHRAIRCSKDDARASAFRYTWRASHDTFKGHLVPISRLLPAAFPREAPAF